MARTQSFERSFPTTRCFHLARANGVANASVCSLRAVCGRRSIPSLCERETEQKMSNKISIILTVLLFLVTLQSSFFYFVRLKVRFIEWLFFNPCATSNIVFLIGFLFSLFKGDRTLLHLAILPMFFFGTLGMFFLSWSGMNIIPQVGHLIMTLNIVFAIYTTFTTNDYKAATIGLIFSIVVFAIFISFQQAYVRTHPDDFIRILVNPKPIK